MEASVTEYFQKLFGTPSLCDQAFGINLDHNLQIGTASIEQRSHPRYDLPFGPFDVDLYEASTLHLPLP